MVFRKTGTKRLAIVTLCLGLAALGSIAIWFLAVTFLEGVGLLGSRWVCAQYGNMSISGGNESDLYRVTTGWDSSGNPAAIPHIFVSFRNGPLLFLPELPEEVASDLATRETDMDGTTLYISMTCMFRYKNGRLISASFSEPGVRVGKQKTGPLFELPATRREVERVLGPPVRWVRGRSKPKFY